jgi:hypothetical protein
VRCGWMSKRASVLGAGSERVVVMVVGGGRGGLVRVGYGGCRADRGCEGRGRRAWKEVWV